MMPNEIVLSVAGGHVRYYPQEFKQAKDLKDLNDAAEYPKREEERLDVETVLEDAKVDPGPRLGKAIRACLLESLNSVSPLQKIRERRGVGAGDAAIYKEGMEELTTMIGTVTSGSSQQVEEALDKLKGQLQEIATISSAAFSKHEFKPTVVFVLSSRNSN
jgi:hypothetical protein